MDLTIFNSTEVNFIEQRLEAELLMEQGKDTQTILGFLHNFRNRLYCDRFFNLCYRRTIGTLKYLKNKGIPIPLDQYAGEDPLSDIAIDILGSYFKSMPGKPFYAIFNQFKNCDINDTNDQGLEEIHDHFVSTFYVFIKQELSRILNESCLLYTSPSPRDLSTSRMPSSA